jgi:hypothetical protein
MSKALFIFRGKKSFFVRLFCAFVVVFLMTVWFTPILVGKASAAAQLTLRSLSLSTAQPSATGVQYTYTFTNPTVGTIQSIKFVACTSAVATYAGAAACTGAAAPSGMTIQAGSQQGVLGGGWGGGTTAFTRDATGTNDCVPSTDLNILCIHRTDATSEASSSKTITWNGQINSSSANTAFYVGVFLYSDSSWSSVTDTGTVAAAIVQTLTVNALVPELLNFCVGSTTVDDATTSVAADCSAVSGSSLNIGTLDPSTINVSPVSTNGGDSKNGIAMLRTNAASGATVSYDAIQQSGTNHKGTLRISGNTCNVGSVSTDGCIDAQGSSQGTFTAGTEKFGMTIAGTNCGSTNPSSYTCAYPASNNLVPQTNYVGKTGAYCNICSTGDGGNGYAWVESGAATLIASSSTVVDDEALILKFAATPSIVTPFGSYTAQADFIAVPTF